MPNLNVVLTDRLDSFVADQVESGNYADASDVVRAALRNLEREQQEYDAKMIALQAALQEGEDSGVFPGDAIQSVRDELGLPARG